MSGVSSRNAHVSCCSQNLVDNLLARWNSLPASEQPPHLGERLEELFLEASMLEAVSELSVRCDGATVGMDGIKDPCRPCNSMHCQHQPTVSQHAGLSMTAMPVDANDIDCATPPGAQ